MNLPQEIGNLLASNFGAAPSNIRLCGGGCINTAAIVTLESGESVFAKWNYAAPKRMFEAEAMGLRTLADAGCLKVPAVIDFLDSPQGSCSVLLLEALLDGAVDEVSLGRGLAALHRVSEEEFGFFIDNYIGTNAQSNAWCASWGEFFVSQRLTPQLALGERAGWCSDRIAGSLAECFEEIIVALDETGERPALLHGDLWSGNVFWSDAGPALIDPATYFGHREADIAFTEMFGGFGSAFYAAYKEAYPLASGYRERKEIYNLYHLMNHATLFGDSYIGSVSQSIAVIRELLGR